MDKNTMDIITQNKIIVIVRNVDSDNIIKTVEALKTGGIKLVEVTFDQSGRFSDEHISKQIRLLSDTFGEDICFGAGTVLNEKQVELAYKAGAKYILSPNTNKAVIEKTVKMGMVSIPGALTPTEMESAREYGAHIVKLFPAGELGIGYVNALLAPLSNIKVIAVGGVDEKNIVDYLGLGILGVGVGSNIVKKDLIKNNKFEQITQLAKKYIEKINTNS